MLIKLDFLQYADAELMKLVVNRFVASGVTDVRVMQEQLEKHIAQKTVDAQDERRRLKDQDKSRYFTNRANDTNQRIAESQNRQKPKKCPECGRVMTFGVDLHKGEVTKHYWCKKCSYGEAI